MNRRRFLELMLAGAGLAAAPRLLAAGVARKRVLYLQPLGSRISDLDIAIVEKALLAFFSFDVKELERLPMPREAYYPPRRRYRAPRLLEILARGVSEGTHRVLGLTGADISCTKGDIYDWGVLGYAQINGPASVISIFRCRIGAKSKAHARVRLAKVAVHEIGHTLGLEHCPNRGCLMEDAHGKVSTCDREYDFCDRCRALLKALGTPITESPAIPWPRPKIH